MGLRPALALALLASALAAKEREYRGKQVAIAEPPTSQIGGYLPLRPVEGELKLDGAVFAVEGDASPRVATTPGGQSFAPLVSGKTIAFHWKSDQGVARAATMRFVKDGERWKCHAAKGYRYKIAEEEIVLVDLDADGRFDLDRDGFLPGDGTVACPLRSVLVLGRHTVTFAALEPDGSALRADTEPIAGAAQQVDALVEINRFRLRNGLAPVVLDPALSAGCTAHGRYLQLNRWDPQTNPHFQSLGPNGASKEGAEAAKRSIISSRPPAAAIANFFHTYYHRIEMMSATLGRIGVNAEPEGLAIVDIADAVKPIEAPAAATGGDAPDAARPAAWAEPYFIPADGSTAFPVAASPEMPRDPVPDMGLRGCPLMMYMPRTCPELAGFRAEIVALQGKRETPVRLLVADRGDYKWIYGIVPEARLRGDTWHRAKWIYTLDGKEIRHQVRFKTE
jgi:hypothetical protein